jgi:poly(hydroxyalkanoate) depolymerase family esterase
MRAPRVDAIVRGTAGFTRHLSVLLVPLWATLAAVSGHQGVAHASTLPGTYFSGDYTNAAGTRSYLGYVPSTYRAGTALPLVVALHGCDQTADALRKATRSDSLAEAKNFIVVFPEQSPIANGWKCWNWFNAANMQRGSGEASLVAGITVWVVRHYSVDPRRIYVMGFSAGGAMTAIMGATYPDLYAAIGVGSGTQYGGPGPDPTQAGEWAYRAMGAHAREMPTLIFHGDRDVIMPVINADKLVRQWQTTADWADDGWNNGSVPTSPIETRNERLRSGRSSTVRDYVDGQGRELVQYWLVEDMGHAWSGGCWCAKYADPSGPDETRVMYDYFVNHPMPSVLVGRVAKGPPPVVLRRHPPDLPGER